MHGKAANMQALEANISSGSVLTWKISKLDQYGQGGVLFGLPVVLDTDSEDLTPGDKVLLQYQGQNLATLDISAKWTPNKPVEAKHCYGTTSIEHPAVQMITMERGKYYLGKLLIFCRTIPLW